MYKKLIPFVNPFFFQPLKSLLFGRNSVIQSKGTSMFISRINESLILIKSWIGFSPPGSRYSCMFLKPSSFLLSMNLYLGNNRLMVASNSNLKITFFPIPFFRDTKTAMYKDIEELLLINKCRNV